MVFIPRTNKKFKTEYIMTSKRSPYFEDATQGSLEGSPLLEDLSNRSVRYGEPLVKVANARRSKDRRSFPLVYTEFRSPEANNRSINGKIGNYGAVGGDQTEANEQLGSKTENNQNIWSKHTRITNLESATSGIIWAILLLPITILLLFYIVAIPWKYTTHDITLQSSLNSSLSSTKFRLPTAPVQTNFIRAMIVSDGLYCIYSECNTYNVDVAFTQSDTSTAEGHAAYPLLRRSISLPDYVRSYVSPKVNNTVETDHKIMIPLPAVFMDHPFVSTNSQSQSIVLTANFTYKPRPLMQNAYNSNANYLSNSNSNINQQSVAKSSTDNVSPEARVATVELLTYSSAYTLCLAVLQISLSVYTTVYLFQTVLAMYNSACKLQSRFASLDGTPTACAQSYLTLDSVEQTGSSSGGSGVATYYVRCWHFLLPEQLTSVWMLFFLGLWQGLVPAVCGLLYSGGWAVSDAWLFASGLIVSCAQFGLVFCIVVYIDGLKYSNAKHRSKSSRSSLPGLHTNEITSRRQSYDPFAVPDSTEDEKSQLLEETTTEFWRRGSLGLKGYSSQLWGMSEETLLTPLQSEYKQATAMYITDHHISSMEFLGFIHRKLIFLLVTWVICVLYWLLLFPRLWHHSTLSAIQVENVRLRCWILQGMLVLVSALWVYWILQAAIVTSARLRRTKLIDSRFRLLAFRSLILQCEFGIIVLILLAVWYIWTHDFFDHIKFASIEASVTYVLQWCTHYGVFRPTVLLSPPLSVHDGEVLLFVTTVVYTIVFSMQPPTSEVVSHSKRVAHSLVTLEQHLPIHTTANGNNNTTSTTTFSMQECENMSLQLRQYLLDEDYRRFMALFLPHALKKRPAQHFCLESALVFLEVSYQTYFPLEYQQNHRDKEKDTSSNPSEKIANITASTFSTTSSQNNNNNSNNNYNKNNKKSRISTNPFDEDYSEEEKEVEEGGAGGEAIEKSTELTSSYEPKMNLTGLGYKLLSSFSSEKTTTFGFLGESQHENKLIVSFRGSLLGNAILNLKFTQVTLPNLKRSRQFFTALIRGTAIPISSTSFSAVGWGTQTSTDTINHPALNCSGIGCIDLEAGEAEEKALLTPSSELIPESDPQRAVALAVDEFAEMLIDHVESGDDNYDEDPDYLPPASEPAGGLKDSALAKNLRSVGSAIPIVNQGFKRVHAGFWESYSSIREEFLSTIVLAMYEYRKKHLSAVQSSGAVSPAQSWYNNTGSTAEKGLAETSQQGSNGSSALHGIRSLFASPLSLKNPFSPMFTPPPVSASSQQQGFYNEQFPSVYSPHTPSGLTSAAAVAAAVQNAAIPELQIVFCGHSLGAAIASLAAYELSVNMPAILEAFTMEDCFNVPKSQGVSRIPILAPSPPPDISLYMYGAPRIGNPSFARSIEKQIENIYRVQVNGDVVTMMPKFIGFYRHFGTAVVVDNEETGSVLIEPTIIERSILQSSTGNVANHSLDKYRACLEACFETDERVEYLAREYRMLLSSTAEAERAAAGDNKKRHSTTGSSRHSSHLHDLPDWIGGAARGNTVV